ncbi:replication initiation and membrane attachment protein [Streptococcus urinalis]|uniref:DnaD domain protein n=1 Tax=Streptococcus urinalis TaxID=149016 RepID=UPI000F717072|nr:DnaD domain protein [Streptococcus urinalis]VEF31181.1 replication initiation and membrane attachment protein [Streptococcus urinalis]
MKPIDEFSYLQHNRVPYDSRSFMQLYFPILGNDASSVYQYFVTFFDDGTRKHKFSEVLNHLQFGMRRFEEALVLLTALDLMVLYQTQDSYLIKLNPTLGNEIFLNNAVYRRLLDQKIGEIALKELDIKIPANARDISKRFSDVFGDLKLSQTPKIESKIQFDLDSFKRLMVRDGLSFEDETNDVVSLYNISEKFGLTWFDIYQIAKETAINYKIAVNRLSTKLLVGKETSDSSEFTSAERIVISEAKQSTSFDFLEKIKLARKAKVTKTEKDLLVELAKMNFLDEVINVMVLYTINKTHSANLQKTYLMKMANDFSYQNVTTAEEAVLKLRAFSERKQTSKQSSKKTTSVPTWSNANYENQTSSDTKNRLEEKRRRSLERLQGLKKGGD